MNNQPEQRDRGLLRIGAVSGVLGVVAALVQAAIDPSYADDPGKAIQQASLSHFLTFSRVLDMTAFLLLLVGVTAITKVFAAGPGAPWARLGRALFTVSAAAGAMATMIVGSLPDVASAWADATPGLKPGYVAVYDALGHVSGGVFTVSWASLGLFGIVFSVALGRSGIFSRTLAGISAASGVALVSALVVGIVFRIDAAFLLLVLGLLLSYVVIVAASVKVWRLAGARDREPTLVADPVGDQSRWLRRTFRCDAATAPMLTAWIWSSAARCGPGAGRRRTTSSACPRTRAPSSRRPPRW